MLCNILKSFKFKYENIILTLNDQNGQAQLISNSFEENYQLKKLKL